MFHKEGQRIILLTFLLVSIGILASHYYLQPEWLRITIQCTLIFLLIIILQFFRNPKRVAPMNFDEIVSPVDGKVVAIEEVSENEYFRGDRKMISIFMSPLNVHVTRYPASGEITYSKYHPGKFLVAWHPKSSEENERTTVVLKTPKFGEILYRQIAGALARRIVNYAEVGDHVLQGEDAGFIKFGSRVDVYLPIDCLVNVKLNQKVKGAETCIASIKSFDDGE